MSQSWVKPSLVALLLGSGGLAVGMAAIAREGASVPEPSAAQAPMAGMPVQPVVDSALRIVQLGNVSTYRPVGAIRGVALFLSGDGGWNKGVVDMAQAMARRGIAVAGVSTPAYLRALEKGADRCINPNYGLTALAQDFEHRLGLSQYIKPIVAGYSSGATVAYAALVQAPGGTYRGAISLGFGPDLPGTKPWCSDTGLRATRITKPETGWLFAAEPKLSAPWIVLQGLTDQVVSPDAARAFTAQVDGAQLIELPKVGHGFSVEANWMPQFLAAVMPLLGPEHPRTADAASVDDLPLTPVVDAAAPRTPYMAVLYSGDGGWAGIDRDVAAAYAKAGVPVVGVDSLSYFWRAKTPEQAGADLARVIAHYQQLWGRSKVLLFGYSFGADTLPFIAGAVPAAAKPAIVRVTLAGLSPTADFQFHLTNWLNVSGQNAVPTVPAVVALRGLQVQCVRGALEDQSACPTLPAGAAQQVIVPGGHHFGGNADAVVRAALSGLPA